MVVNENGRKHIEVRFFDGIYEDVRCCYHVDDTPVFRITECCGGETYLVTRGFKDHVQYVFNLRDALSIMEETGNLEEADRLWMEDQIRFLNKTKLGSVYGKMCQEV